MKKCSKCKKDYPVTEFFLDHRDGSRRSYCRKCSYGMCKKYRESAAGKKQKQRIRKKYHQQQHNFFDELKSRLRCNLCDEPCVACLDFHHLGDKDNEVTALSTWTKIFSELKKCVVLCCKCHRKGHAGIIAFPNNPLTIPMDLVEKYVQKPERVKNYLTLTTSPLTSVTSAYQT